MTDAATVRIIFSEINLKSAVTSLLKINYLGIT